MPPQRTLPPSKALKTERTHEENQERAYIAASRRSDRSLEARVESARRASEIHKRRTGRSLRVTEQDVVNEEMYEEEDDDLPMQYRRLTAHLQTGSADFNRRLSAYLTNHVAMRSALDQAITNSYAQQYPNAPQFAHNHQNMYPSPFIHQNMPQQQSPQTYAQSPYTMPPTPTFPHVQNGRSQSVSGGPEMPRYSQSLPTSSPAQVVSPVVERRRTSAPSKSVSPPGSTSRTPQLVQATPTAQQPNSSCKVPQDRKPSIAMQAPPQPLQRPQTFHHLHNYSDLTPLSTSLPAESQQMLSSALDPNDSLTSMLMSGSENMAQPFYNPTSASLSKTRNFHPSFDGMSATLAPSALDMTPHNGFSWTGQPPAGSMSAPPFQMSFDPNAFDFSKGQLYTSGNSSQGSGAGTPGMDGNWEAFINDGVAWADNAA